MSVIKFILCIITIYIVLFTSVFCYNNIYAQSSSQSEQYYINEIVSTLHSLGWSNVVHEVTLWDHTRVDIACRNIQSELFTAEVDFAKKWAEGVGQAQYYKKTADAHEGWLILIVNNIEEERHYVYRACQAAEGIKIYIYYQGKLQSAKGLQ